ncbi:hypothetical protein GVN16_02635 [Emticicia sp. CRIBPO]|uniref:capsule assembly Wzi family protein n=1 Tax=Emticicia sp. CRIBPO TaxID=2683258 RepID=UPI001412F0F7|nr:capsule assembly Wzi family protein [Emticicia sp. CRIBPO]NBA84636.1 hypothetical protein [Emticicia sp. CRIBPO]
MRNLLNYLSYFLTGFACLPTAYAQKVRPYEYKVELGTYYSINNKIPFWMRSNQFGVIPKTGNTVLFRQSVTSKKDTTGKFFKFGYGADMAVVVGNQAQFLLPEAYLKFDLGIFSVMGGRKKQVHGIVDSTLSSGSVTWSGNSLPMPEVQLAIPEYRKLIFKWLFIKGHYSHAWFMDQEYVKNYYLHQKALYGRIGKAGSKVKFYGGILHNVQWGGKPKYDIPAWDGRFKNGKLPSNWFTYKQVVLPFKALRDTTSGYTNFELENRFGNHVGQFDIGGEIRIRKTNLMLYKQTIFETGQTFSSLTNADDGLYGLSLTSLAEKTIFRRFVFEFLFTKNQGSYQAGLPRLLGLKDRQFGNDTYYFNHAQYLDGWSYNRMTIGTPFMIPDPEIRIEKRNTTMQFYSNNNRIRAFFIGMNAKLNSVDLEMRASLSRNFGTARKAMGPADQMSLLFTGYVPAAKLKGNIKVSVGIDQGDLINDNYGVNLSYQRIWK